jgi:hypothetical protein
MSEEEGWANVLNVGKKYTLRHQCIIKGIHMIKELEDDKKEFVDMK